MTSGVAFNHDFLLGPFLLTSRNSSRVESYQSPGNTCNDSGSLPLRSFRVLCKLWAAGYGALQPSHEPFPAAGGLINAALSWLSLGSVPWPCLSCGVRPTLPRFDYHVTMYKSATLYKDIHACRVKGGARWIPGLDILDDCLPRTAHLPRGTIVLIH